MKDFRAYVLSLCDLKEGYEVEFKGAKKASLADAEIGRNQTPRAHQRWRMGSSLLIHKMYFVL